MGAFISIHHKNTKYNSNSRLKYQTQVFKNCAEPYKSLAYAILNCTGCVHHGGRCPFTSMFQGKKIYYNNLAKLHCSEQEITALQVSKPLRLLNNVQNSNNLYAKKS